MSPQRSRSAREGGRGVPPYLPSTRSFWNTFQSGKGIPHDAVNQGLGATINIINGIECNGGNAAAVANRVKHYTRFCEMLGVEPGAGQGC